MLLLTDLIRKQRALTLLAFCSSGIAAVLSFLWNAQLSGIINIVSEGLTLPAVKIAAALATMLCMSATAYFKSYISGIACESMSHDLRMGYASHFSSLPVAEIEALSAGEQLSKLQNEIADVSKYLNGNLFQLADDSISFITTFIWLLILNPKLTLMVNLPAFAIMIYVFWSSRIISNAVGRSQQAKSRLNGYADTLLTVFPIIRLYDAARLIAGGYNSEVTKWERQTVLAERVKARLMSLSGLMTSIPLVLLFLVGGGMAINGAITVGTLYIFLNLSGNVSGVMMNMPGHVAALRQFAANIKRLAPNVSL